MNYTNKFTLEEKPWSIVYISPEPFVPIGYGSLKWPGVVVQQFCDVL